MVRIIDFESEAYNQRRQQIAQENCTLLSQFMEKLIQDGLSANTVEKHISNMDFYLNTYLLLKEAIPATEGLQPYCIEGFLGNFFIYNCCWSSPAAIQTYGASLKKFYSFMMDLGLCDAASVREMKALIKESTPEWQEDCRRYDDPDYDNPFYSDFDDF